MNLEWTYRAISKSAVGAPAVIERVPGTPLVRCVETEVAVPVAAHALPYSGSPAEPSSLRPHRAPLAFRRSSAASPSVRRWRRVDARVRACPPVPFSSARLVRRGDPGRYRAAVAGAAAAGRPLYLLDPAARLPERSGRACVALFRGVRRRCRSSGRPPITRERGFALAGSSRSSGLTEEPAFLDRYLDGLAGAGAGFAAPLAASGDAEARPGSSKREPGSTGIRRSVLREDSPLRLAGGGA